MARALFVMEQQVGHRTYYQNLRRFVDEDSRLDAAWVRVSYKEPGGFWERLPVVSANLRGALRGRAQVRAGLMGAGHDFAFYNTQVPAAMCGKLARQRPYIVSTDITPIQYDQMRFYGHRPDPPGPLKAYKHRVNVETFGGAAWVLPWSAWTRDSLVADYGVDPARIAILPPGVDLGLWMPGGERPQGSVRLLFVGGDLRRKGGDLLLEAFRALRQSAASPELELHLVTRTPVAPENGVLVYADMQPNAPALIALYQESDLFVLPTWGEAFGIAAVEASAVGLPVIATRVGGLTDVVVEGETGLLIEPGDVQSLVDCIRRLAGDAALRQRLGQAARARAEARFNARQNARRVVDMLMGMGG
jgi:glycosyltransferase involved in cell wall biosynthesis